METLRKYGALLLCMFTLCVTSCDEFSKEGTEGDVLIENIVLDQTSVELKAGRTLKLTATVTPDNATNKKLEWASDAENVAIVEDGKVTALSEGQAIITVTTTDGSEKDAECVVTVLPSVPGEVLVEQITLSKNKVTLKLDEAIKLTASIAPANATDTSLVWLSTNQDVAIVQNGEITAVGVGSAIVRAVANDGSGVDASCAVTVEAKNPGDDKPLSPVAAKNKMESAGLRFVNAIKAETHQNLVELTDYAAATFEDFDIDEAYYEKLQSLAVETGGEDYVRGVNPARAMVGLTTLCLDAAQNGAQLATRAADVYTLTVKAGLNDLYGKFTPDYKNEVWKWNSSVKDRVEVAFADADGQQWVATLKGSKETTRVKITYRDKGEYNSEYTGGPYDEDYSYSYGWDDRGDYTIDVPKQITFVVKCGTNTIVDLMVNSSLAFEMDINDESKYEEYYYWDYWSEWYFFDYDNRESNFTLDVNYSNLNMDAKMMVNGYEETFKADITKKGVTASAGIKIDGRSMLKANAAINADMDALIADAESEEFKARNIQNFSMNFDILGEVQVDAECQEFKNLYDAIMYLEDAEGIEEINSWLNEVNAAYSAKLRFDNTSTVQATFEAEAREEEWDNGETSIHFYPVMVFASNDSRHAIEDYFTESSFSDLIDAVEDLAGKFEELYEDYFEEECEEEYH